MTKTTPSMFDDEDPPQWWEDLQRVGRDRDRGGVEEGRRRRDEAMDQVSSSRDGESWLDDALPKAIRFVTRHGSGMTFTSDDIWDVCSEAREPRVMGPLMQGLRAAKIAEPTDAFKPSRRPERHGAPIRVWRAM